jgi:hypothetical protein
MNISILEVFWILIGHWVADFILQTDWQATNKSKNNYALLKHVLVYSAIMSIFIGLIHQSVLLFVFFAFTFLFHFLTDYFTSRLNSELWAKGDVHNFFVSVGFDQILHYYQLIFTYWYLFL